MISNKVLVIILIALIVLGFTALRFAKSESAKCLNDPIKYSLSIMEKQSKENVTCSCYGGNFKIIFNNEGMVNIDSIINITR